MIREKQGEDEELSQDQEMENHSDKDLNTRVSTKDVEDYKEADFEQFANVTIEPSQRSQSQSRNNMSKRFLSTTVNPGKQQLSYRSVKSPLENQEMYTHGTLK